MEVLHRADSTSLQAPQLAVHDVWQQTAAAMRNWRGVSLPPVPDKQPQPSHGAQQHQLARDLMIVSEWRQQISIVLPAMVCCRNMLRHSPTNREHICRQRLMYSTLVRISCCPLEWSVERFRVWVAGVCRGAVRHEERRKERVGQELEATRADRLASCSRHAAVTT